MKKIILYIQVCVLCVLSFLCTSCFSKEDFGYPETISFPAEGGEIAATGEVPFWDAEIQDYKGNQGRKVYNTEDMEAVEYDWLRVEYKLNGTDEIRVIAKPNSTSKSRKLYIELYSGPEYDVIEVKQK